MDVDTLTLSADQGGSPQAETPTVAAAERAAAGNESPRHRLGGPRPAPCYKLVDALMDRTEDGPGPRCGHTLTSIAAVGQEGRAGYVGPRLVLFGGVTSLEGNQVSTGSPMSPAIAGVRM